MLTITQRVKLCTFLCLYFFGGIMFICGVISENFMKQELELRVVNSSISEYQNIHYTFKLIASTGFWFEVDQLTFTFEEPSLKEDFRYINEEGLNEWQDYLSELKCSALRIWYKCMLSCEAYATRNYALIFVFIGCIFYQFSVYILYLNRIQMIQTTLIGISFIITGFILLYLSLWEFQKCLEKKQPYTLSEMRSQRVKQLFCCSIGLNYQNFLILSIVQTFCVIPMYFIGIDIIVFDSVNF
ncbi:unnamed protein product [Trichobilharzia szidati]|nr:unnamed protein product [Trichobilharzia szidati]